MGDSLDQLVEKLVAEQEAPATEAELHRLKGVVLLVELRDGAAAEGRFTQAFETARRQQSKARELRASGSRGAYDMLATNHAACKAGRTTPDLAEAVAMLEALP